MRWRARQSLGCSTLNFTTRNQLRIGQLGASRQASHKSGSCPRHSPASPISTTKPLLLSTQCPLLGLHRAGGPPLWRDHRGALHLGQQRHSHPSHGARRDYPDSRHQRQAHQTRVAKPYHAVRVLGARAFGSEGATEVIASQGTYELIVERFPSAASQRRERARPDLANPGGWRR